MKLKVVIDRIKAQCPTFSNRVSGFSDFLSIEGREDTMTSPCCFVVRLLSDVLPNEIAGAVQQVKTERFGVFVCVDARADEIGYDADDKFDDLRRELITALCGWSPSEDRSPFEDEGFENVTASRARAWRRFDFSTFLCE